MNNAKLLGVEHLLVLQKVFKFFKIKNKDIFFQENKKIVCENHFFLFQTVKRILYFEK